MTVRRRLAMALPVLLLAACSGKPSDADAVRLFGEDNQRLGVADLFSFENVKRVNGYEDGQRYIVEMQFDMITKKDYDELVIELTMKAGNEFLAKARLNDNIRYLQTEFGKFSKGQRFTKKRPMVLQRTEAGWALAK